MVISLSPVKRKTNYSFGLNILFTLFSCDFKFVVIYTFFPPNLQSKNSRVHKKRVVPKSVPRVPNAVLYRVEMVKCQVQCRVLNVKYSLAG